MSPSSSPPHYPPQILVLLQQAGAALQAGRPADALPQLRAAARQLPGDAGIHHDLGLACLECGLIAEAIGALQQSLRVNPAFVDSHLRLGVAFELAGHTPFALSAYATVLELDPSHADAGYRCGNLLYSLGREEEAARAFEGAALAAPGTVLGLISAARAGIAQGLDEEAQQRLREALEKEPGNPAAHDLLGNLLADAGRFDEARGHLERAVQTAPWLAGSYYEIARCRRIGPQDTALLARMRAALDIPGLPPIQRARVRLGLGKAAEDLGRHQEAMRHFDEAERLRSSVVRFDPEAFARRVDQLIACFTPERLAAPAPGASDDATPVLIVGLPRSGTTLLEQALSAHPQCSAGGELAFWNERGAAWDTSGGQMPDAQQRAATAADYMKLLRRISPTAARVTDKMPLNFQWAGLIHLAFPQATIIHIRRNLLDTALSIHQTHFNVYLSFPTGGAALVRYVREYERLMAHWRAVLPPERFIEVCYEALVETPQDILRALLTACGLSWNEACLQPHASARAVKTPSRWQARQPIYRSSVGRWRAYEPWLGELAALRDWGALWP